jgi:hypothetical protein
VIRAPDRQVISRMAIPFYINKQIKGKVTYGLIDKKESMKDKGRNGMGEQKKKKRIDRGRGW